MTTLGPFTSWPEVLAYAKTGGPLYYQAPMDRSPARFLPGKGEVFGYVAGARTIKMWPPGSVGRGSRRTSDPFSADAGHLDRFSRPIEERMPSPGLSPSQDDGPISMTYGELPSFKEFERDIRRLDPDHSDGAYWPAGTLYPMELVVRGEIELAENFGGLEEFEAERNRTGRNTRVRGFRGDEKHIYDFIEYLIEQGDEEATNLASSIMMTLGYEWI